MGKVPDSMERDVARYVSVLETRGYSPRTIDVYGSVLRTAARTLDCPSADVTLEDLEDYIASRYRGKALETKRHVVTLLQGFFQWLVERGKLPASPAAALVKPRLDPTRPTYYTPEQVALILSGAWRTRDRIALLLLARHGQRVSAVCGLRWSDVNFDTAMIHYPPCKRRLMNLPLDEDTGTQLKAWRRLNLDAEYVFPGQGGGHLSPVQLRKCTKAICKRVGVPYRGCHEFRRTLATTLLLAGEPLHRVSQGILGHASVTTTVSRYAGADDTDVAGMLKRLPY